MNARQHIGDRRDLGPRHLGDPFGERPVHFSSERTDRAVRRSFWAGVLGALALVAKWVAGLLLVIFALAALARLAFAADILLPADPAAAVEEADVVVIGTVNNTATVVRDTGVTETLVSIAVSEVKRGTVEGGTITLRELGGRTKDGGGFVVPGSPDYRVGAKVLVLANKRPDGTLRTHLMDMGRVELAPPNWWTPWVTTMQAAPSSAGDGKVDAWKRALAAAAQELPSSTPRPTPTPLPGMFPSTTFGSGGVTLSQREARTLHLVAAPATFKFMGGRWASPATVVYDAQGDRKLGREASNRVIDASLFAWTSTAPVPLVKGGAGAAQGFACSPGNMLVSFDDPREEIEDPRGCSGVLAIGGFCADNPAPGETIGVIRAGALVFNDGWATSCPQFWTEPLVLEIGVHEVGHAIGLSHSCESGEACDAEGQAATMYWMAHFDGRGATLRAYDVGAVRALYPSPTPAPSPSPTHSPRAQASPTASPTPTVGPTSSPVASRAPTASPGPSSTPRGGCQGKGKRTGDMGVVGLLVLGVLLGGIHGRRRDDRDEPVHRVHRRVRPDSRPLVRQCKGEGCTAMIVFLKYTRPRDDRETTMVVNHTAEAERRARAGEPWEPHNDQLVSHHSTCPAAASFRRGRS